MAQKVEFLQGKGLTDTEIQQALAEAAGGGSNPSAAIQSPAPAAPPAYARPAPSYQQQPHYGFQAAVVAPEPPKRDWRDIFVSTASFGWSDARQACAAGEASRCQARRLGRFASWTSE